MELVKKLISFETKDTKEQINMYVYYLRENGVSIRIEPHKKEDKNLLKLIAKDVK